MDCERSFVLEGAVAMITRKWTRFRVLGDRVALQQGKLLGFVWAQLTKEVDFRVQLHVNLEVETKR